MARFTVTAADGRVMSNHRTDRAALLAARKLAGSRLGGDLAPLTVHEFPDGKSRTGHPVMRIDFSLETDWRGTPLMFWNDGSPVL